MLGLLADCSAAPLPQPDAGSLGPRVVEREDRVSKLEARQQAAPPYRSKDEIQTHIRSLEEERGKLLGQYTAEHPAIRDINRKLDMLRHQLDTHAQP